MTYQISFSLSEGFYGIAATDKVEFGGAKAILVSDVIECQRGTAHLRFMYWTSPEVKISELLMEMHSML
jgi:hypothetical protein